MKKYFMLMIAGGCLSLLSCNSGGESSAAKKNRETNQAITKAYEAGEWDKVKELIAPDAIDHAGQNGDVKGIDNIIADMKMYRAMMPDMKSTTIREMADDEYVMTWSKVSGTMEGKPTTMTSIDVAKFKDGKATEHWMFMEPKELMAMMGTQPAPAPSPAPSKGDTVKAEVEKPKK